MIGKIWLSKVYWLELIMLNKIKLLNGTEVSWEEFSKWSEVKQRMNLVPISEEAMAQRIQNLSIHYSEETEDAKNIRISKLKAHYTEERRKEISDYQKYLHANGLRKHNGGHWKGQHLSAEHRARISATKQANYAKKLAELKKSTNSSD